MCDENSLFCSVPLCLLSVSFCRNPDRTAAGILRPEPDCLPGNETVTVSFRETGSAVERGVPDGQTAVSVSLFGGIRLEQRPLKPLHVDPNEWRSMIGELREDTEYELEATEQPSGKRIRTNSGPLHESASERRFIWTIFRRERRLSSTAVESRPLDPLYPPQSAIRHHDEGNERYELIKLNRARYILLENLTLKGDLPVRFH